MDLKNFNFCRPPERKLQDHFRMMSTSSRPPMDFTMVPLDVGKLTVPEPQDFTPPKVLFKTATLKSHQFSPSVTIGGFVGSKSQTRSYINNRNQLYDVLIGLLRPYVVVERCFIAPATSPQFSSSQKPKPDIVNTSQDTSTPDVQKSSSAESKFESSKINLKVPEVRSYAEVAKMPWAKGDCLQVKQSPIRRFQQNTRDKGRPRSIEGNWRERETMKDFRRDRKFVTKKAEDSFKHKSIEVPQREFAKNPAHHFRNFKNSCNKKNFQSNNKGEGVKNRIIHEKHPNFNKNSNEQSTKCVDPETGNCSNWRCRQPHTQKSTPKQEIRQMIAAEIQEYTPPRLLGCLIKQLPTRVMERISPAQASIANTSVNIKEKCTEALNSIRENGVLRNLARMGCSPRDQRKDSTSSEEVVFRASECDSEDSFVMFENEDMPDSLDPSDSSDSDWSELEECNVQPPWLTRVNRKWDMESQLDIASGSSPKKVKFDLATEVHLMVAWEFAYRNARCGHWEEMARDRERFRLRVARVEPIIAPILTTEHRQKAHTKMTSLQAQ